MIATQGAKFSGKPRAAAVAELLRMQLDWQAQGLSRLKNLPCLGRAEGDALAKGVDGIDEPFCMQYGQYAQDFGKVIVGSAGKFGWHGMCAQKRRAHIDRLLLAELACHGQGLAFIGQAESVTGFDFNGGHAFGHQVLQPRQALFEQRVKTGCTCGPDGGDNATAFARNVFVTGALQASFKFLRAMAAVNQMRVAVDQPGGNKCPLRIMALLTSFKQRSRYIGRRAHPGDALSLNDQCARLNQAVWRIAVALHCRNACVGP